MLNIGNKTFMNLQEAVGWLLENNALPFQSTANYVANTEIAMSTLVNPSPAKVRVGSLIFFADSKVSTVVGVTSNSFIVSDQYNDLVDDITYVSNVAINASGHLICTLSNGDTIDAGLIKQVSNFSIDASQHLIANYNDGSSTDLGAIFTGNINLAGTFNATSITGDSIIENMSGYSFGGKTSTKATFEYIYAGVVKNGNKLTLALAMNITRTDDFTSGQPIGSFVVPNSVGNKLFTSLVGSYNLLGMINANISKDGIAIKNVVCQIQKPYANEILITLTSSGNLNTQFTINDKYYLRFEATFLLSNNMAS